MRPSERLSRTKYEEEGEEDYEDDEPVADNKPVFDSNGDIYENGDVDSGSQFGLDENYDIDDDTQGRWRFEYNALLNELFEDFTAMRYIEDPKNKGHFKLMRIRDQKPLITIEGAKECLEPLKALLHKGVNLSRYDEVIIMLKMQDWDRMMTAKILKNHAKWGLTTDTAAVIKNSILDNIEAVHRKAVDGKEMDYSYKASEYRENVNVNPEGGRMNQGNSGIFSRFWGRQ